MKDECYETYIQIRKILNKLVNCLDDEDFQLLLITLLAKTTISKVRNFDLQKRISS